MLLRYKDHKHSINDGIPPIFKEAYNADSEKLTKGKNLNEWNSIIRHWFSSNMLFIYAYHSENRVAFLVGDVGKESVIRSLWVKNNFRKNDIGSELINKFERFALNENSTKILIKCYEKNIPFFKKDGFIITPSRTTNKFYSLEKKLSSQQTPRD